MDSNYLALGDVKIPLKDTFICGEVHLPQEAFTRIVNERGLNVELSARNCDTYPFRYQAKLNGVYVYMISEHEYLFD